MLKSYEKHLNNWVNKEKLAVNLLNSIGTLMYDKGIEIVLFRNQLLEIGVSELMNLFAYANNIIGRKTDIETATLIAEKIQMMALPPSKLDIGLLTAEFIENNNFDFIVAPEHDGLEGKNVLKSKGAIHYLRENELEENKDYLKSKLYLFEKLLKKRGNIITDFKIPEFSRIKKIAKKNNFRLNFINSKIDGLKIVSHKFINEKQYLKIKYQNKIFESEINLIGRIQINNILMAILAAERCGINFKNIISVLKKVKPVKGRLEKIGKIKNNSKVILDYAHTPAALEAALISLKDQFPNRKLSLLFGCGGDRDFEKRYAMGRIAARYSDIIYLTDDNPRNEKPSKIRNDIKKGIKKTKFFEFANRKKAIHTAIENLNTGELLLIAGKGHETGQVISGAIYPFNDLEQASMSIELLEKQECS